MIDDYRNKSLGRLLTISSWLKCSLWFMVYGQILLSIKNNRSEYVIVVNGLDNKYNLTTVKNFIGVTSKLNLRFLSKQFSTIKIKRYNNHHKSYINQNDHKYEDAIKSNLMKDNSWDAANFDVPYNSAVEAVVNDDKLIGDNKNLSNNCMSCVNCVEFYSAKCINSSNDKPLKAKVKSLATTNDYAGILTDDLLATALNSDDLNATEIILPKVKRLSKNFKAQNPMSTLYVYHRHHPKKKRAFLLRRKRYLSFPEGALLTVSVCMTVGIIGNPRYNYMSYGLNWGVAYDLPNATWALNYLHDSSNIQYPHPDVIEHLSTSTTPDWQQNLRRSQRSVYQEIEYIVNNLGYPGRSCVLRALCESSHFFPSSKKLNMLSEILRAIFSYPLRKNPSDPENHYHRAYKIGIQHKNILNCKQLYSCKFSLLELALGLYSQSPILPS